MRPTDGCQPFQELHGGSGSENGPTETVIQKLHGKQGFDCAERFACQNSGLHGSQHQGANDLTECGSHAIQLSDASQDSANQAASISKKYITGLQKFDITTKVSRLFSQYGITGNIKITRLRTIKIKAGGIFLAYSLKDIVWDLLQFDQWGDEQWQNRLTKHCYEFLDQAIVGAISGVIATVIAGVGFGIAGIAVPAGVMVVIVAVAAILIGLFIGWLIAVCYGEDFSFTKYAFEGSASRIIETVYGIQ